MKKAIELFLFISLTVLTSSCKERNENIKAGSICTIEAGEGKFGVIKVLVIDDKEAHVKIYKNQYDTRPCKIDITKLSLGSINDTDGFGIGHIPLDRKEFDKWKPIIAGYEDVSKSELE
ncbi:MAG TPA: hypothetical protein VGG71_15840, partial [Chitinophagaceae bacterium]